MRKERTMSEGKADIRKITRGFQVTLPQGFRQRHGLNVGDVVEMVEVGGELRVQPVEITRKHLQAELNQVFQQADEIRDPSLEVSSDEEAMEVANKEIEQRRKEKK